MDTQPGSVVIGDPDVGSIVMFDAAEPFKDGYDFVDFTAEITAPRLAARSIVRTIEGAQGLKTFFADMAEAWQGWEGLRTWESIEHDLTVEAGVDHRGHVRLAFTLRDSYRLDAWAATVVVTVEAGEEMAALAADVAVLLATE